MRDVQLFQFGEVSEAVWELGQLIVVQFQNGEDRERAERGGERGDPVATAEKR